MAVHSLKPATDRRLGGLLPRQPANQTRAHPVPPEFFLLDHAVLQAYAVLATVSSCCPPVQGRLPTRYSPVRHSVTNIFLPKDSVVSASFDLHVLGTPPAFILSQDQTLMFKFGNCIVPFLPPQKSLSALASFPLRTYGFRTEGSFLLWCAGSLLLP